MLYPFIFLWHGVAIHLIQYVLLYQFFSNGHAFHMTFQTGVYIKLMEEIIYFISPIHEIFQMT